MVYRAQNRPPFRLSNKISYEKDDLQLIQKKTSVNYKT